MASSIPAARQWLYEQFSALTDDTLSGVLVAKTGVWEDRPELERVIVENARGIDREWAQLGRHRLTETYTITVFVETESHETDVAVAETRLWEIVTLLERVVVANPTMDGTIREVRPAGAEQEESGTIRDSDVAARITLQFACQALVDLS